MSKLQSPSAAGQTTHFEGKATLSQSLSAVRFSGKVQIIGVIKSKEFRRRCASLSELGADNSCNEKGNLWLAAFSIPSHSYKWEETHRTNEKSSTQTKKTATAFRTKPAAGRKEGRSDISVGNISAVATHSPYLFNHYNNPLHTQVVFICIAVTLLALLTLSSNALSFLICIAIYRAKGESTPKAIHSAFDEFRDR